MERIIFFENDNQYESVCSGTIYFDFLDYAFAHTDYFMLVYVNYYGKGYSPTMKDYSKKLEKFKIKTRTNPCWPGTLGTYSRNTTYKVVFYRTAFEAKTILKTVSALNTWSSPSYPQDLAFFKGNQCWFYSVGHENIAAIIRATNDDLDFVESRRIAHRTNAKPVDKYYSNYDECLISKTV